MKAQLLHPAHDDLLVVNSARVSFAKKSNWLPDVTGEPVLSERDQKLMGFLARNGHWTPYAHPQMWVQMALSDAEAVAWLLKRGVGFQTLQTSPGEYMVKGSLYAWVRNLRQGLLPEDVDAGVRDMLWESFPYACDAYGIEEPEAQGDRVRLIRPDQITDAWMAKDPERAVLSSACFLIDVPFFVARQLGKHQDGFVQNEVSRRYVTDDPTFWEPDEWRAQSQDKKQGSDGVVTPATQTWATGALREANAYALEDYQAAVEKGIAAEQARAWLTMAAHTQWYWTASLNDYARLCAERLAGNAQQETREPAQMIAAQLMAQYPKTWSALMLNKLPEAA
jgi:thymidylate synthase (FAD)